MHYHSAFLPLLGLLAGCAVGPEPTPSVQPPETFDLAAEASPGVPDLNWWEAFDDPVLTKLLHRVSTTNLDLAAATARLRSARHLARATIGGRRPSLNASGSAQRAEQSEEGLNPLVGANLPSLPVDLPARTENLYRAGLDASWEIDLFGRQDQVLAGAEARVQSAALTREDLLRTLLAETGQHYLDYRTVALRLDLLDRNVELRTRTEDLAKKRRDAGLGTDFEVARARAARLNLAAHRPALQAQADAALRALAILAGSEPGKVRNLLDAAHALPRATRQLGVGVPCDLLQRRPDIRLAESQLALATADLGVATADLYPRLTLIGSIGVESIDLGTLGDAASRFWSLGPRLTAPLFHAGILRERKDAAAAEAEARFAAYRATILRALREVEGAANRLFRINQEVDARLSALEAAREAHRLADLRYRAGTVPLDELLATEIEMNAAEEQQLLAQAQASGAVITLGKTLGGGWPTATYPAD